MTNRVPDECKKFVILFVRIYIGAASRRNGFKTKFIANI